MDVDEAKKIYVKFALCDFQYEIWCLHKKNIIKKKDLS